MSAHSKHQERDSIDPNEIEKFSRLAEQWWDPKGEFAALHSLNPLRLAFIREQAERLFDRDSLSLTPLKGLKVLDVGCGGGLLSEPLSRLGAEVTAIDAAELNIEVARAHSQAQDLAITYRHTTAEDLLAEGAAFDLVVSMEVVEHVADPFDFLESCAQLVKPGGGLALATLNRTPKSFLLGIVAAEYVLRWVARGTHDWRRFLKPSEMAKPLRKQGLKVSALEGLVYNPLSDLWQRSQRDLDVNYLLFARKI